MRRFVDLEGLDSPAPAYLHALEVEGEVVEDRLNLLARLREGAGCIVYTGPKGAAFWSLVSPEVQVWVVPDGYEYRERVDEREWAYLAVGCNAAEARELRRRDKEPTARHRLYHYWAEAERVRNDLARQVGEPIVYEPVPFRVEDVAWAERFLSDTENLLALDWEWQPESGRPIGLAISDSEQNVYVPLWASDVTPNPELALRLERAFEGYLHRGGAGILHNGRSDIGTLLPSPQRLLLPGRWTSHDTIVLAYLIGEDRLGLKPLSRKYLGREPQEYPGKLEELPARMQARYAAAGDTRNTYDLYWTLLPKVIEAGQWEVYQNFERPLVPIIADMERAGVPVSIEAVKRAYREHIAIEEGVRRAVRDNYGRDIKTDAECLAFLHDQGLPELGTLDQRVISQSDHWSVDLVLTYRQTRTRRRNFLGKILKQWVKEGKPIDFRLYPSFNQAGSPDEDSKRAPRSGRLSSSNPNLQNQPRKIRDIYVPPRGHKWWSFDYSGLELHIAAALSGDEEMLRVLSESCPVGGSECKCGKKPKCGDLHGMFQHRILELTGVVVERTIAKAGNFEQLYGGKAAKLVQILAKDRAFIDLATAEAVVRGHEATFPQYHKWAAQRVALGYRLGYAETYYGRRRFLVEFNSPEDEIRSHGERACVNHAIQGTAADIVKKAMIDLVPVLEKYGAHLALQVHDELDGWVPEDVDLKAFEADVKAVMQVDIAGLPLRVEGGVGDSWAEVH